jgi:hypothetical protein
MANTGSQLKRFEIPMLDGVNMIVGDHISKKSELSTAENTRGDKIGVATKREGYRRLGNELTSTANFGIFYFDGAGSNFYRISTVTATTTIYYLSSLSIWTALTGAGTGLSAANCDFSEAEGCLFVVNGTDANRYIQSDGTTVVTSTTATGHLYNSPKAYKINYFKDKLYVADYYISTTRYPTSIMKSSEPLGIVSLVDGDHAAIAIASVVKVTDTKYIQTADTLDVYRGGVKIADITTNAKTEDTITIATVTMAVGTAFNSADEIWVDGTYTGTRVFRWAYNPSSGENVKQYDTMKLTGGDNSAITLFTNIGNVMVIANKYNIATYNGQQPIPTSFDLGIGCISSEGYVKALGTLFFVGHNGIYATTGDTPKMISAKIQPLFDGATKAGLEASAMGVKGLSIFASLGDVTLYNDDGSVNRTLTDVVVERNLRTENWSYHTGIDAKYFHRYITATDIERLEYCGSSGHVYELLYGNLDDNSDEIPFRIDTGNITLSSKFENFCYPKSIIVDSTRGVGIKCFISLDNEEWYELDGESEKGVSTFKVSVHGDNQEPARCRNLNISLREFSDRICSVSRIAVVYSETAETEEMGK